MPVWYVECFEEKYSIYPKMRGYVRATSLMCARKIQADLEKKFCWVEMRAHLCEQENDLPWDQFKEI